MKQKQAGAELLAPPSAHELVPPSSAISISQGAGQNRKKPHILPPIADRRVASVSILHNYVECSVNFSCQFKWPPNIFYVGQSNYVFDKKKN
jgi:hypothetical protein